MEWIFPITKRDAPSSFNISNTDEYDVEDEITKEIEKSKIARKDIDLTLSSNQNTKCKIIPFNRAL